MDAGPNKARLIKAAAYTTAESRIVAIVTSLIEYRPGFVKREFLHLLRQFPPKTPQEIIYEDRVYLAVGVHHLDLIDNEVHGADGASPNFRLELTSARH